MEELERKYIKDFLMKMSEDIENRERKYNRIKELDIQLKIMDKLLGLEVHKGDFVKLYNEVFEVNKEYIKKLKLIYDKYNKNII